MNHRPPAVASNAGFFLILRTGVFAWPAWLRVLAVLPACSLLWLGVYWALA